MASDDRSLVELVFRFGMARSARERRKGGPPSRQSVNVKSGPYQTLGEGHVRIYILPYVGTDVGMSTSFRTMQNM